MGYYSTVEGRIEITPPLSVRAVAGSPYLNSDFCLKYEVSETREEVPEGTLIREQVVAIVPSFEDQMKAYALKDDLKEMVEAVHGEGSECSGELVREGERNGDVERYRIVDGAVVSEKARLVWADGTEVSS
jgi:hypothetical protein